MKIALGLSGGLDSAAAALILLEAGHEVVGITMQKWSPASGILAADKRGCFGPSEPRLLEDSKALAQRLGIRHYIIDLKEEFSREVLSYYRNSYRDGKTPNPCLICNRKIKFAALLDGARALGIGFELFATGHYARRRYDSQLSRWQLLSAVDKKKDQSYFLSGLCQAQLAQTIFPLGEMHKTQVREFAESRGYTSLIKTKESQDFLESYDNSALFLPGDASPGDFVDWEGKVLGQHKGLIHYTIGQRKGLGLAGFAEAQYVIGLDKRTNTVIIGPEAQLYSDALYAKDLNWLSILPPENTLHCSAKIRLAQDLVPCTVQKMPDDTWYVKFAQPVSAITPGQIVAFYDGELVLGAGEIV